MNTTEPPCDLAVLVGNGLSISFNDDLTIPRITADITARLDAAGETDDPAAQLMQEVARRVRIQDAGRNFEALVAPFDEFNDGLKLLTRLAGLAGERRLAVRDALLQSADFAHDVRRHAVSHILDVIAQRSIASHSRIGGVDKFLAAVINEAHGGEVTLGNLNYDSLVMASLCGRYDSMMCDLTDGRLSPRSLEVVKDEWLMEGRPLRLGGSMPINRKITLLHLHGSLAWLRHVETGRCYRVAADDLRDSHFWQAWREGRTNYEPVVVLTNQSSKAALVGHHPFSLAYETFEQRLMTADKWLIAGASLGDDCLNDVLRRVWARRATLPAVLVVTKGGWPSDKHILDSLGFDPVWGNDPDPSRWLEVHRDGIETAPESWEWMCWRVTRPIRRSKAS